MPKACFEPCGAERWRDPFPMYRALRDDDPVHRVPDNGEGEDYWVLSRFEHVLASVVDARTFSSADGLTFHYGEMEKLGIEAPIVMMDPPAHTALRKLAIKRFTPQQVKALEPMLRAFVVERVERLREQGEGDVVAELLKPLPSLVVSHFLGVPSEDRALFDRWSSAIVAANAEGNLLEATEAVGEMFAYLNDLIEKRRREPGEDMISALVHGRLKGGEEVSLAKILGMGFTMVTGGNDTATGLLGGALELLSRHPEQRAGLAEEPERMKDALEEFLRLSSPVQGLARTATRDVTIEGTTIPAGRKVLLLYGSANRDEREFGGDAAECDVTRKVRRHLTFGYGPHHCIGAAAARLQASIALEELLRRCPEFSVDAEAGRYAAGPFVRRFEFLPFDAKGLA
ncbi:MAG: cytochrome P450 [Deltaproteobacteria bacterium]|nr:cytochrome P450 [Deltaproteobacteria bacterium]MBW2394293.1 cytochrome P450 [Deltaproteobacteria bacterium]